MSHNFETEDARIAAAKVAGRNIAAYEIRSGYTTPRNWDKDGVQNARVFSHLAAVGFSRAGTRMYSQTFVDAYKAEFIRLRLEYLRSQLQAEKVSYGELLELQGLAEHIQPGDVELLEAAGVPEQEFPNGTRVIWTDPDGGEERHGRIKGNVDEDDAYWIEFDGFSDSDTQVYGHELRAE